MANWYIDPGLGTGTNAGTSWANAFNSTTLAWTAAITASAAGDDFYVNAASTVSNGSLQTLTFKGTAAAPNRIFGCSTITNNPPLQADLVASGGTYAAHTTTGAFGVNIAGFVYCYGLVFNVGTGTTAANVIMAAGASNIIFDTCKFNMLVTTATGTITVTGASNVDSKVTFINTPVQFAGGVNSGFILASNIFSWRNTPSAISTGSNAAIANLFQLTGRSTVIVCDGVDFAGGVGIASGKNIVGATSSPTIVQFVNCKYTSGALIARPTGPSAVVDMIVTDSGATGYKQQRDVYQGTLTASTTVYNNASDGVTPISWQVITTANAKPQSPFECFQIVQWVAAGTYASSKVFLTSATASLKTNDVWADIQYLGASYALASPATSFGAGSGTATLPQIPAGTTPGTLAAASPAWGTGGLGNDYQLVIPSFTTSAAGWVRFTVKIGKASLTVNIDPAVTVA